ncbi:tripartite tricarboxylate transporter substrate binding protein [Caballeronia sp. LZ032]|uniref:Bug family tripartite tricarboxylate transporter substrate binding protein n=1 Tax=Caballeronia sp. LZ032 TaxID=3038565 RepID=UPI00285588B3|nr:tripartite tricarboxylate transporter substrate binding protein [Caballeronia sp. LZ032]MDR5880158.1 tripartite tricarboxylate transporter substrate binding protein [Caballeronia sp. LZ032]
MRSTRNAKNEVPARLLRAVSACVLGLGIGVAAMPAAHAGGYPDGPIKLLVGFPPGGGGDTYARIVATALSKSLDNPVVVENRPGAGGDIAADIVAHAKPDGYTLLLAMSGNFSVAPVVHPDLRYKVPGSFAPISMVVETPFGLLVSAKSKYKTIQDYVAAAKGGKLTYASTGTGGAAQSTMEIFKKKAGLDILNVPFTGSGPATTALLGGQVDSFFAPYTPLAGQLTDDGMRLLATSGAQRNPAYPDVPTFRELGWAVGTTQWYGVAAPAGTPPDVVAKLNQNIQQLLKQPDVAKQLTMNGAVLTNTSGDAFAKFIESDIADYRAVVKPFNH